MKLEIEMPLSAANLLKTTPPPPGVTFESIEQYIANEVPTPGGDITVTVTLSVKGAIIIASVLAIWIKQAFTNVNQKRIKAKKRDIRVDSDSYVKMIEELCDEIRKEDHEHSLD